MALLELLAAAARARIVAADASIRIRNERRLGDTRFPALHRRGWRFSTRDQTISGRFRGDHRGLPPSWTRESTGRPRHSTARRARPALPSLPRRRANLDLQLEPALRERRLEICHQPDEHLVGVLLVFDERILLSVAAQIDALAELVQIVEMILPFLVDDAQADVCERLLAESHSAHSRLDLTHIVELFLKRGASRFVRGTDQLVAIPDPACVRHTGNRHQKLLQELGLDELAVPLPRIVVVRDQAVGQPFGCAVDHPLGLGLQLFAALEGVQPARVDDLALLVHHVIELQQLFAGLEVLQLDTLLRLPDRRRHPRMRDDLTLLGAGAIHDARDAVRAEQPHEVVFERQIENALARIALTAGATAQLAVNPPRLVPLGADDDQPAGGILVALELLDLLSREIGRLDLLAERGLAGFDAADLTLLDARTEFDVGPSPRHVRRDGDGSRLPRLCDDLRFALVKLGVEHLVFEPTPLQQPSQRLGHFDIGGADQHGETALVLPRDLVHDRVVLLLARLVDEIVLVHPADRPVRRNDDDLELVDLVELGLFGLGGARHPGKLLVHAEVVLDRDRRERLRLLAHRHAFFRLHRLVQAVRPPPPRHQPAGELVDDEDLAVLNDVLDVFFVERVGLQQLVDDMQRLALDRVLGFHGPAPLDLLVGGEVLVVLDLVDGV